MKKNILKTTALLIALAGLFASCSLFEDDDDDDSPSKSVTVTKAVLALSLAGEGAARSALPSVSSAQEFESFDFEAANETASITKSWAGDSEKTAYAKMTSTTLELDTGTWILTLTGKKGGMTYRGSIEKEITAGANRIEFTLSLADLSNEGRGSVEIKLSVPASVKAVTVSLCNTSENEVSDSSIVQSTNLTNNTVSYSAQKVPSGTYLMIFSLYADTEKTLLLGKWREYAGITSEVKSSSEIAIDADNLDDVYTITYELNGGTLKGNWSGSYTRYNQDVQLPTAENFEECPVEFLGWYTDENFNNEFNSSSLTGNLILYAKWKTIAVDELIESIKNKTIGEKAILGGEITSERLSEIVAAMNESECYLTLDLSMATGLTTIGSEFKNCIYLTGIAIPKTVTSIGFGAFSGCSGLTEMTIPFVGRSADSKGINALFGSIFGNDAYDGGVKIGQYYQNGAGYRTEFYIPNTLRSVTVTGGQISYGSFYNCYKLTSITLPDSVTSIGDKAFHGCSGLTSVIIPDSVVSIGVAAFSNCKSLTSVIIPDSVVSIGKKAFEYCESLESVTIGDGVLCIEDFAFSYCSKLTNVTIGTSVASIGDNAFTYCSELTSVTILGNRTEWDPYFEWPKLTNITIGAGVKIVKVGIFRNSMNVYYEGTLEEWLTISFPKSFCVQEIYIQGIKLTDLIIPNGVTSIRDSAFCCKGLTSVLIPDGVTSIGNRAFYGCSGLTSVSIPDSVTSIGAEAFSGCSGLTSVLIPDSVTSIGTEAFRGCRGLTSLKIPDSVTSIGNSAFSGCSGLTSVSIPGSVTSIGDEVYKDCGKLASVTIGNGVTGIGNSAFSGCSGLTSILIPDSVTSIGNSAFSCSGLTSVSIPSSVTSIGDEAYKDCSKLASVTILGSVTSGHNVFEDCNKLTSVTIGKDVKKILSFLFNKCNNIESVYYEGTISDWCLISFYDSSSNPCSNFADLYIQGVKVTDLVLPNDVKSIGNLAFCGCRGLTSISIPDSVTSIGDEAFYGCSGLTSVSIPDSVTSIGYEAFSCNYDYTMKVYYNGTIEDWLASSYEIISFNWNLYIQGSKLEHLRIPNSVTSIRDSAFGGCRGITGVLIPETVTSIGAKAFYGCSGLTGVSILGNVTSIGAEAFSGCSGLTSFSIPSSVTSIGQFAFHYCSKLSTVNCSGANSWTLITWDGETCSSELNAEKLTDTHSKYEWSR